MSTILSRWPAEVPDQLRAADVLIARGSDEVEEDEEDDDRDEDENEDDEDEDEDEGDGYSE